MNRCRGVIFAGLLIVSCFFAPRCLAAAVPHRSWTQYGGGADQSKFVEFDQITKSNVNQLQIAWTYGVEGRWLHVQSNRRERNHVCPWQKRFAGGVGCGDWAGDLDPARIFPESFGPASIIGKAKMEKTGDSCFAAKIAWRRSMPARASQSAASA